MIALDFSLISFNVEILLTLGDYTSRNQVEQFILNVYKEYGMQLPQSYKTSKNFDAKSN